MAAKQHDSFLDRSTEEMEPPRKTVQPFVAKNQQQVTTLNKEEYERKQRQIGTIEGNLLQLNLERDKFKNEFDKIPENPKTIAQKRRREDLERELGILNKNIASLKTKLREFDVLH